MPTGKEVVIAVVYKQHAFSYRCKVLRQVRESVRNVIL